MTTTNLQVLGTATTNVAKLLYPTIAGAVHALGNEESEALEFVITNLVEEDVNDPRGVYVEHDGFHCKPFTTEGVNKLIDSGLVSVHRQSCDAVAFLHVNADVALEFAKYGKYCNTGTYLKEMIEKKLAEAQA